MEQHPIPQQISSYEFKLVGEMTLKQFLKAAAGVVLALLIYASKLVFFIKWPLVVLAAGGGLALAFLPFQDRPLDTWLLAFFKSIYSPTIFVYKKKANKNWLEIETTKAAAEAKEEREERKISNDEFLMSKKEEKKKIEFIQSIPKIEIEYEEEKEKMPNDEFLMSKKEEQPQAVKDIKINEEIKEEEEEKEEDWRGQKTDLNIKKEKLGATGRAVFGAIPMPNRPETANVLVGMVLSTEEKIVEGAIIEIQDSFGNSVRVLKSNALGQFKTLTPLANGKYLIITEKEGFDFDRVEIEVEGKIVEPIKIISK